MAGKKKQPAADCSQNVSLQDFYQALERYRRDDVLFMLKKGVMNEVTEEEKPEVWKKLFLLRDRKILDHMAKELKFFPVEILDIDYTNRNNREFVTLVLSKYVKKFDMEKEDVCDKLFEAACAVENKDTILLLIQKKKASGKYSKLVTGSEELFKLINRIPQEMLTGDLIVDFFVEGALSEHCAEVINGLVKSGFDVNTKNKDGLTASDILERKIRGTRYAKNKSGDLKKKQDLRTVNYLERLSRGLDEEPEDCAKKKKLLAVGILVVIIVIVLVVIGLYFGKSSENSDTTSAVSAEAEYE